MSAGASITVTVSRDTASPYLRRLAEVMVSVDARKVIARGLERDVRDHLIAFNAANPNRHAAAGWRRSNIVKDAADATHGEATADGVRISINHPMVALRYFGGTVTPVRSKLLAIPIAPGHPAADPQAAEAYGQSPRAFHHLRLVMFGKTGVGALIARDRSDIGIGADRRKGREGQKRTKQGNTVKGGIYYWLVPQATITANPAILPTDTALLDSAARHATDYIDTITTP
jgi:hypothetical protein